MGEKIPNEEVYVGRLSFKSSSDIAEDAAAAGLAEADHEALQSIVNNLVKLPEEEAPPKVARIARITHNQISAMRITQSNLPAAKVQNQARPSMLIQSFDAFMGLFRPQERRSRCSIDGHECRHCGQVVRMEAVKNDAEKAPESPRGH